MLGPASSFKSAFVTCLMKKKTCLDQPEWLIACGGHTSYHHTSVNTQYVVNCIQRKPLPCRLCAEGKGQQHRQFIKDCFYQFTSLSLPVERQKAACYHLQYTSSNWVLTITKYLDGAGVMQMRLAFLVQHSVAVVDRHLS